MYTSNGTVMLCALFRLCHAHGITGNRDSSLSSVCSSSRKCLHNSSDSAGGDPCTNCLGRTLKGFTVPESLSHSSSQWQLPSSKRPMKYLSPHLMKLRRTMTRLNQKAMMKSLKHYRKYDVTLHDDQSNELLSLDAF